MRKTVNWAAGFALAFALAVAPAMAQHATVGDLLNATANTADAFAAIKQRKSDAMLEGVSLQIQAAEQKFLVDLEYSNDYTQIRPLWENTIGGIETSLYSKRLTAYEQSKIASMIKRSRVGMEPRIYAAELQGARAQKLDPNDAEAYRVRGYAYYSKGDYDRAIADFTQAIKLDPNDATTKKFLELCKN